MKNIILTECEITGVFFTERGLTLHIDRTKGRLPLESAGQFYFMRESRTKFTLTINPDVEAFGPANFGIDFSEMAAEEDEEYDGDRIIDNPGDINSELPIGPEGNGTVGGADLGSEIDPQEIT